MSAALRGGIPQCAASPVNGSTAPIVIEAFSAAAGIAFQDKAPQVLSAHAIFRTTVPIGRLVIRRAPLAMADVWRRLALSFKKSATSLDREVAVSSGSGADAVITSAIAP